MAVLLTCKNETDPTKNEGARVLTSLYVNFLVAQGQLTPHSVVEFRRNSNSSKLLWLSSLPTRTKRIKSKMKALECQQDFPHYESMRFFSNAQGQLTLHSDVESSRNSKSSEMY